MRNEAPTAAPKRRWYVPEPLSLVLAFCAALIAMVSILPIQFVGAKYLEGHPDAAFTFALFAYGFGLSMAVFIFWALRALVDSGLNASMKPYRTQVVIWLAVSLGPLLLGVAIALGLPVLQWLCQ